jgi:hypothetical protein
MSYFENVFKNVWKHGSSSYWGQEWLFSSSMHHLDVKGAVAWTSAPYFQLYFYFEIGLGLHEIVNGGMLSPGMNAWGLQ